MPEFDGRYIMRACFSGHLKDTDHCAQLAGQVSTLRRRRKMPVASCIAAEKWTTGTDNSVLYAVEGVKGVSLFTEKAFETSKSQLVQEVTTVSFPAAFSLSQE